MATENLNLEAIELTDNMQTSLLQKMNGNFDKIDTAYGRLRDLLLARTGKDNLKDAIEYVEQLVNAQDGTITPDKVFNGYVGYSGLERIEGKALATESTGNASQLLSGEKLYDSSGTLITGTMTNNGGASLSAIGSISGDNYNLQIPENGYYDSNAYLTRTKADVIADFGIAAVPNVTVTCDAPSTYISNYGAAINPDGTLVIWAMTVSTSYEHVYFYPTSIGAGVQGVGWSISSWDTSDPIASYACTVTGLQNYSTVSVILRYDSANSSYDYVRLNVTITAS